MAKHPAEVFGCSFREASDLPEKGRKKYWCPFADDKCNKQSRLIKYPMGVCSVQYGDNIVALCPSRFLQDNTVFKDIADHYFQTRNEPVVFSEIGLSFHSTAAIFLIPLSLNANQRWIPSKIIVNSVTLLPTA